MTDDTPSAVLRDEITQTRAELGDTIEALAAKTDVKARTKEAVVDAKTKAKGVRDQAVGAVTEAAAAVGDQVRSETAAVRESLADGDIVGAARKPLPIAAFAFLAGVAGLVIYLARRRSA